MPDQAPSANPDIFVFGLRPTRETSIMCDELRDEPDRAIRREPDGIEMTRHRPLAARWIGLAS